MDDLTHANYGLSAGTQAHPVDDSDNSLPRAVLRPGNHFLLDGTWRFAVDLDDIGLTEEWAEGYDFTHTAQWPGSIEEHMAQAHTGGATAWQDKIVAWYEREFTLPELAESQRKTLFQLTFGACGYETRVWLNGQLLTTIEGESIHYGEYTSFTYELPEEYLHLNNRLTVRIADTMDAETTRGKQESHVYKRGGIWYQTYTGAVRSVWLETVERNRLRSRVGVVSTIEDQLVRFNLTLRVHDAGDYVVRLQVFDSEDVIGVKALANSDFPLRLTEGQHEQRLVLEIPGAEVWCPENPHRYRLVAQLIDEAGYVAQIEARFGLRK
ncbi:MAG: glycoside hydrolase family 2, partial [Hymenobacter sp.]